MSEPARDAMVRGLARRLAQAVEGSTLSDQAARWADAPWSAEEAIDEGLARLAQSYSLSRFEIDLVALAGLPEEHEVSSHAARLLHPHGEPWMSTSAICRVLDLDSVGRQHARRLLHRGAAVRCELVVSDRVGPYPEWSWRLAPGVWNALAAVDEPGGPDPAAEQHDPMPGLDRFAAALRGGPSVVVVAAGAHRSVDDVVERVTRWLADLDLGWTLHRHDADNERAHGAVAVIAQAIPVVVGPTSSVPLADHPGPVVVCVASAADVELDDRPSVVIELSSPGLGELAAMWNDLAPEVGAAASTLAGLLRIDATTARRAVADARAIAAAGGQALTAEQIVVQARRRSDGGLPPSVRLVRADASWERLVTTERNDRLLRGIVERVGEQATVLDGWGFSEFSNHGVRTLLSGPPGTGKTLATHVLATALGLDLLVVDLSSLVSKWLGETEKHISEVFAAADRSQAVLFFDEAEALFGQRTDGSDAQGRWANLETAHLLNRLDAFDGLVV
ncbi:MAG: ATP-binding protein, partial [Actinomycetota bacterium]